jgi:hypothetical protein
MADSGHAPMSEAIVGTATGQAGYREQRGDLSNRDFALVLCG